MREESSVLGWVGCDHECIGSNEEAVPGCESLVEGRRLHGVITCPFVVSRGLRIPPKNNGHAPVSESKGAVQCNGTVVAHQRRIPHAAPVQLFSLQICLQCWQ